MYVVGVVGPEAERSALVGRLVDRLAETGSVGTVVQSRESPAPDAVDPDVASHRDAGATTSYAVGTDGWVASGDDETLDGTGRDGRLDAALERLARHHEFAVVSGFQEADVPTVAIDGAEHAGETLASPDQAGDADLADVVRTVRERDPFETLTSLVETVEDAADEDRAGAVATFTGRVRAKDAPDDQPTEFLEFERYDDVAADRMARIVDDLESRDGVYAVALHHRTGVVHAGEHIVHVAVLAGHRGEAFATVQDGINRLKDEVPLFKREVTTDEEFWVHERA